MVSLDIVTSVKSPAIVYLRRLSVFSSPWDPKGSASEGQ